MNVRNRLLLAATTVAAVNAQLTNWTVSSAEITISDEVGVLHVNHTIGAGATGMESILKEILCVDDYDASGPVTLENEMYDVTDSNSMGYYTYDIVIDTSTIGNSGIIQFCTVVSSVLDIMGTPSPVSTKETNFDIEFDLSTDQYFTSIGVSSNEQDQIDEFLPSSYSVTACYCFPGTFICGTPPGLTPDSEIYICLIPFDEDGPTGDVVISNFDMTLAGTTFPTSEYEPVEFGTQDPQPNPLTNIAYGIGEAGEVVQVTTRFVASLFVGVPAGGSQEIDFTGNTFLEFSGAKVADTIQYEQFDNTLTVFVEEEDEGNGCRLVDRITNRLAKLFGTR